MGTAENYKHLYEQMKKLVAMYQDEIVPGMREQLENRVEVVRCKDCKHWFKSKEFSPFGWCLQRVNDLAYVSYKDRMEPEDFCSKGERKDNEN